MSDVIIPGFQPARPVDNGETVLPVYVSEGGTSPLIVLHELPGMSPPFLRYITEMAEDGFRVYAPLMFKSPGTKMGALQTAAFCMSQTFREVFEPNDEPAPRRPFIAWLRYLVREVAAENAGRDIGVIGMCLTGGFALGAIAESPVSAVIACQPAYPMVRGVQTLGLAPQEYADTKDRAATLPAPCARGYRFRFDPMSRPSHMRAARALLGEDGFDARPSLPGLGHSTLTGLDPAGDTYARLYDEIRDFLTDRLS